MAYTKLTQPEIMAREQAIVDAWTKSRNPKKGECYPLIQDDRAARWANHVAAMTVRAEIATWAQSMAVEHGPKVRVNSNPEVDSVAIFARREFDWITALMIIRYGEAEYHWPMEFSAEDVERATEIADGNFGQFLKRIRNEG